MISDTLPERFSPASFSLPPRSASDLRHVSRVGQAAQRTRGCNVPGLQERNTRSDAPTLTPVSAQCHLGAHFTSAEPRRKLARQQAGSIKVPAVCRPQCGKEISHREPLTRVRLPHAPWQNFMNLPSCAVRRGSNCVALCASSGRPPLRMNSSSRADAAAVRAASRGSAAPCRRRTKHSSLVSDDQAAVRSG